MICGSGNGGLRDGAVAAVVVVHRYSTPPKRVGGKLVERGWERRTRAGGCGRGHVCL